MIFGFHTGVNGLSVPRSFFENQNANNVPFFAKQTDGFPFDAQEVAKQNPSTPNIVIYRRSTGGKTPPPSGSADVPDYTKTPKQAAVEHWEWHKSNFPAELDPSVTWVETINEVDKNRIDWLAEFCYETSLLTERDGYKWLAFGWSTGEPELYHWDTSAMAAFLTRVSTNPDKLGIAVHEYSLDVTNIMNLDGWLIGRCNKVLEKYPNLPIYITEWGWTYNNAPSVQKAQDDILFVGQNIYKNPQIRGAAIWALNGGWNNIATKIAPLIPFVEQFNLENYIPAPEPPPVKHKAIVLKLPQEATVETWLEAAKYAGQPTVRRTITASHDDTITILQAGNEDSWAQINQPDLPSQQETIKILEGLSIKWQPFSLPSDPVFPNITLKYRPCDTTVITQYFGENPPNYIKFNLPGHEGIDYAVGVNLPFYAVQDGTVVHASNKTWTLGTLSAYGYHVVIDHGNFATVYAHASATLPVKVGDFVKAGQIVGFSGNTGNSTGYHLHFSLLSKIDTGNGYPIWRYGQAIDPYPYLKDLPAPPKNETIDLLPYIKGDGKLYEVRNSAGSQERFQTQEKGGNVFLQTKNQLAECFFYDEQFIYRDWDTSPGNNRFYRLKDSDLNIGSRWIPRYVTPGQSYTSERYVQFYNWDCTESSQNSGKTTDTILFVRHYRSYTFQTGLTIPDVIKITWVNGGEDYFYAKGFGLVAWQRSHQDPNTPQWSAISEIHAPGQRADNNVILPSCLK